MSLAEYLAAQVDPSEAQNAVINVLGALAGHDEAHPSYDDLLDMIERVQAAVTGIASRLSAPPPWDGGDAVEFWNNLIGGE